MSIFNEIGQIKQKVRNMANNALNHGWIDEKYHEELSKTLEKEKITVGIVGQMKNGKSTLLNALVFGDKILPTASTPMTASLTYLTYGKDPMIEVEFYSSDEWREIEKLSKEKTETDEIRAAKELVQTAHSIKDQSPDLLGKKKNITFDELHEYVAEGGCYVPITKALNIHYPSERLKGIDIVDTPGFNDPVSSRESRAKEFLSVADVVLVVLYAGRPFDKSDRDIIYEKIRVAGMGKVVLLLNKYDLILSDYGTVERVISYVRDEHEKEVSDIEKEGDEIVAKILRDAPIVPISSLMALLGKMEENSIHKDEDLKHHFEEFRNEYPTLKSQKDLLALSKLADLEEEIEKIVKKDKMRIIVNKPVTAVLGKMEEKHVKRKADIYVLENEEKGFNRKKSELEREKKNMEKVDKEITEEINKEISDMRVSIIKKNNDVRETLNKEKSKLLESCDSVAQSGFEGKLKAFKESLTEEWNKLKKAICNECEEMNKRIDNKSDEIVARKLEFSSEIFYKLREDIANILNIKREINMDISPEFKIGGWFTRSKTKTKNARKIVVEKIFHGWKITTGIDDQIPLFDTLKQEANGILTYVDDSYRKGVLAPVKKSLEAAIENYDRKDERLKQINEEIKKLKEKSEFLSSKIKSYKREFHGLL